MKHIKRSRAVLATGLITLIVAFTLSLTPNAALASGGGGGGGGSMQSVNFSGNWSGTITTSFGTGLFTMTISQSGGNLNGSAHFGAPIFDATLKLTAATADGIHFSGLVFNSKGSDPITGTLSQDGTTITGTVMQGEIYTYIVHRN